MNNKKMIALMLCLGITQVGCYNSYFISKNELKKLESNVEQKDTVTVYGDCPEGSIPAETEQASQFGGPLYAQADTETSSDATEVVEAAPSDLPPVPPGCTPVDVSTNNSVEIVTTNGDSLRVTPFNFVMSQRQLVSPEYDLLENLSNIEGAKVSQFSTWKTVGLVAGITAAVVGVFVGVGIAAGDGTDFKK